MKKESASHTTLVIPPGVEADTLNTHYAAISTDTTYTAPNLRLSVQQDTSQTFTEFKTFQILDHLKSTATGMDGLPSWFLRLSAPITAAPISEILNLSLLSSHVPAQWKTSIIKPIPKIPRPVALADYRPISITPVLSRLTERVIVSSFVYPNFTKTHPVLDFSNQFAFRPTGSTTSALIYLMQSVSNKLVLHPYVRVFALDFSKAFDTIRHSELLSKYAALDLPDHIHNWLVDFFTGRNHCTTFNKSTSLIAEITSSIVQGSALGPASYAVVAADLKTVHASNDIAKFADDTYLIVPANNSNTISDELQNIGEWSRRNNLHLNKQKSHEIIFSNRRPNPAITTPPPLIDGIIRVATLKCLGVTLSSDFSISSHINATIISCAQSLYALRHLRASGLCDELLQTVFSAVTLSKLLYASPLWWGFASSSDRDRLETFLRKAKRAGFYNTLSPNFSELCQSADQKLFKAIVSNPNHVLFSLLPPKTSHTYLLRPRSHPFQLPPKRNSLDEKNFLTRMLFSQSY